MADNANSSYPVIAACSAAIGLSCFFFGLRILSRWMHERHFDLSDSWLAGAVVIGSAINGTIIWMTNPPIRLGTHMDESDAVQFSQFMKALMAIECVYVFALGCAKLSFLTLFLRMFPGKQFRILVYFTGTVVICWAWAVFFASIFQCRPIAALWDLSLRPTATCLPTVNFYIAIWVPNITTDLAILSLPQLHVWKLQIDMRTKIALACTFLLGGFAIVANVVRFSTFFTIDDDFTWSMVPLAIWTALELAATVISASLPTMRPLLLRLARRSRDSTGKQPPSHKRPSRSGRYELSHDPPPVYGSDAPDVELLDNMPPNEFPVPNNQIYVTHTTDVRSDAQSEEQIMHFRKRVDDFDMLRG